MTQNKEVDLKNNIVGSIRETAYGADVLTIHGWIRIQPLHLYQGIWPTEDELPGPPFDAQALGTILLWRGELYINLLSKWERYIPDAEPEDELFTTVQVGDEKFTILATLEPGDPLPNAYACELGAAVMVGKELWVVKREELLEPLPLLPEELGVHYNHVWEFKGELGTPTIEVGDQPVYPSFSADNHVAQELGRELDDIPTERTTPIPCTPVVNILGSYPLNMPLPDPNVFKLGDGFFWREHIWVKGQSGRWEETPEGMPKGGLMPFTPENYRAYLEKSRDSNIDERLMLTSDDDWHDKGSMARVLMETRKENKRLKRNRLIAGVLWRLLFVLIVGGLVYGAYLYVMSSITTGRYTDERSCKVSKGNLTITGKRTFSYPYKTLFGFRLVDENKVLVDTVMNVIGDKITVVGIKGNKSYWQNRAGMGEKGIMILKDADMYLFQTDKELIVATSDGFCNPIQRELDATELKQPVLDIIK